MTQKISNSDSGAEDMTNSSALRMERAQVVELFQGLERVVLQLTTIMRVVEEMSHAANACAASFATCVTTLSQATEIPLSELEDSLTTSKGGNPGDIPA